MRMRAEEALTRLVALAGFDDEVTANLRFSWYQSPGELLDVGLDLVDETLDPSDGREPTDRAFELIAGSRASTGISRQAGVDWCHCRLCRGGQNLTGLFTSPDPHAEPDRIQGCSVGVTNAHFGLLREHSPPGPRDADSSQGVGDRMDAIGGEPVDTDRYRSDPWHGHRVISAMGTTEGEGGPMFGNKWLVRDSLVNRTSDTSLGFLESWSTTERMAEARWDALRKLSSSASWWVFIPPFMLLVDLPTHEHLEQFGKVGWDGGPAITYADGSEVHIVGGELVPSWWVDDRSSRRLERVLEEPDPLMRSRLVGALSYEALDVPGLGELILSESNGRVRETILERVSPELIERWAIADPIFTGSLDSP